MSCGTFGLTNGSHVPVLCLQQVNASLTGVTRTRGNLNVATRAAGGISPSPNSRWAMRTGWQAWMAAAIIRAGTSSGTRTHTSPGAKYQWVLARLVGTLGPGPIVRSRVDLQTWCWVRSGRDGLKWPLIQWALSLLKADGHYPHKVVMLYRDSFICLMWCPGFRTCPGKWEGFIPSGCLGLVWWQCIEEKKIVIVAQIRLQKPTCTLQLNMVSHF